MNVSIVSFEITAGVGLPLAALCLWVRKLADAPWVLEFVASVFIALALAPTIWAPFEKPYVESAAAALFVTVVGLMEPRYGFGHSLPHLMAVGGLAFWAMRASRRRRK